MKSASGVSQLITLLMLLAVCVTQVQSRPTQELKGKFSPPLPMLAEAMATAFSVCQYSTGEVRSACVWHHSKVVKVLNRLYIIYKTPNSPTGRPSSVNRLRLYGAESHVEALTHKDYNVALTTASHQIISYCAVNLRFCKEMQQIILGNFAEATGI